MLQVARLAPKQLGESRDLVAGFLREQVNPTAGFRIARAERSVLHRLRPRRARRAAGGPLPVEQPRAISNSFGDGAALDFVHLACLARAWAALRRLPDARRRRSRARAHRGFPER